MADYLILEQAMIDALKKQYKSDKAESFKARYFAAKDKLFTDILPWIRTNEPDLTDHSNEHIENILDNIHKLISQEIEESLYKDSNHKAITTLTGLDLYFLCQVALFHDVGNFYGRSKHNQSISKIIKEAFSDLFDGVHKRERKLIAEAGRAHTGSGEDGTKDTMIDLFNKSEHIQGDHINYCSCAAIVRFADELAEGPQRTSSFMQKTKKYSETSTIYHKYASCTHIKIDSPNQRISISYDFNIDTNNSTETQEDIESDLKDLLELTYSRITKLDEERKYFNYYCKVSKPIRETQVTFNFQKDEDDINIKLEPLILNDLVVPGSSTKSLPECLNRDDLKIDNILKNISSEIF